MTSKLASDVALKACFDEPLLDVMNFLNEVISEFPDAISLAPGRPFDVPFDVGAHVAAATRFVDEMARRTGRSTEAVWCDLGTYGRTNGVIADLIAAHLACDEHIDVDPSAIIVTVGAQEAMAIVLAGLFDARQDILLVSDPAYIGITGLARLFGITVVPVPSGDDGLDPEAVEQAIVRASREGRVRALYDVPDFNNPLGTSVPLDDRRRVIDVCHRHGVLLIEDNPYGMFAYDHDRLPTLKSLDRDATVLYIGSFAKTLSAGLRLGYLVADQRVDAAGQTLATALSRVKSLLTVNTPPLLQAIVGGVLLETGGSLLPVVEPKRARYRQQRDAMVQSLERACADLRGSVRWNVPAGGFFLTVTLPFEFGVAELRHCAAAYRVIVSPMQFFCLGPSRRNQIRLSFSYATPDQIGLAIERLAAFVRDTRIR